MTPDGKDCENDNECLHSPCQNEGICVDHFPPKRYECECPNGIIGDNCENVSTSTAKYFDETVNELYVTPTTDTVAETAADTTPFPFTKCNRNNIFLFFFLIFVITSKVTPSLATFHHWKL